MAAEGETVSDEVTVEVSDARAAQPDCFHRAVHRIDLDAVADAEGLVEEH